MFWQGGFTFYAAVVVPIGQQMLGPGGQALITREVTFYLNLSGAIALALLALDIVCETEPSRLRRWGRWLSWLGMVLILGVLVWLHGHLIGLLNEGQPDRSMFRFGHRCYLWLSTVQWGLGLLYVWLTLSAWLAAARPGSEAQKKVPP